MTKNEEPKSSVTLFVANTIQIVSSSIVGSQTVELYNLDDPKKPPSPEPLSKFYSRILNWVIAITVLCLLALVCLEFIWPEPTTSQQKTLDLLIHGFTTGFGCLVGLLVGKQAR